MIGKVTLVGAGPGDPGLLTVKGREALLEAQVVVYDRLVSPAVLSLMPENAEKINVGKEASHHLVPQEQINCLLLNKALEGKRVVRLKGGDPFLSGRGGEELELLTEHGVSFEEVPGITSAIAVPAYGGIPVTHREFTSSLHIITGHARAGKPLEIDFEALVRTRGTLVFLMGVTSLPDICAGLLEAGMNADMPAAIVEQGTTPRQRRFNATVGTLAQTATEQAVTSPAISIVGPVCALAEKFDWFDALPLKGKKIVVTRPRERSGTLTGRLSKLGADVYEYPCIRTEPIIPCPEMEAALNRLGDYTHLVLTSPAGVEALWGMLEREGKDARALSGVTLAAIGPGTDRELRKHGLRADYIPAVYDAAHLGAGLAGMVSGRVLILRAELGSPALTEALERGKIPYDDIHCYTTAYESEHAAALRALIREDKVDIVTFTSASTVRGFAHSVGEDLDFSRVLGACIGEQTAAEARRYGIRTRVAAQATMDALIDIIIKEGNETWN